MMNHKTTIRFFDIETTNLAADFGRLVSFCWSDLGEKKVHKASILEYGTQDPLNDRRLAKLAYEKLSEADIIVGHYSTKFDLPFINSRLRYYDMSPVPPVKHIDTCLVSRYKLKLQSNRLDNVAAFFGLSRKTKLDKSDWLRLSIYHPPTIRKITNYCVQDVQVLKEVYLKLRPMMNSHPNVNITEPDKDGRIQCPRCGSHKVQKRGWNKAHVKRTRRYHCQSCFSWSRGKPEHPDPENPIEVR